MAQAQSTLNKVKEGFRQNIESQDIHEGDITKRIEMQTAKIPSVTFLNLAVGSMVLSAGLAIFANRKDFANFVGLWAPSFMLLGIYNKLVKLEGSDMFNKPQKQASR